MNDILPRCLFGDDRDTENGRPAEGWVQYKVPWCRFWRDGFAMKFERDGRRSEDREGGEDSIMLRVEWFPIPLKDDGQAKGPGDYQFFGRIYIQILAPAERDGEEQDYQGRFMEFLKKDPLKSPLARFGEELRTDDHAEATQFTGASHDWALRGFGAPAWATPNRGRYPSRHDVAFSYRQADEKLVSAIARALPKRYLVYHSGDDSERTLDPRRRTKSVLEIYEWLAKARLLIVVATEDDYLKLELNRPCYTPQRKNLHCPHELAQAAKRQANDDGQNLFILVDSKQVGDLDSQLKKLLLGFAEVIPASPKPAVGSLEEFWSNSKSWIDEENHKNVDDFLSEFGSDDRMHHVMYDHTMVMGHLDGSVNLENLEMPPKEAGGGPVNPRDEVIKRLSSVHRIPEGISRTISILIDYLSQSGQRWR
jgi:hypothetical protein